MLGAVGAAARRGGGEGGGDGTMRWRRRRDEGAERVAAARVGVAGESGGEGGE
jgi:hypothetical protein